MKKENRHMIVGEIDKMFTHLYQSIYINQLKRISNASRYPFISHFFWMVSVSEVVFSFQFILNAFLICGPFGLRNFALL